LKERIYMKLSIQLAPSNKTGLLLANPVMTASGTCGYGTETGHLFDVQKLGAFVCKGTTLEPREGNPQPRIAETSSGMLNSIGLENIGVEAVIKDKAPDWAKWKLPVIVNIAGESVNDYARMAKRLNGVKGINGLEVNISCPNVEAGGAEFGTDPVLAATVTRAVKKATTLPVLVKLTPNTSDIVKVAQAVEEAGADALTVINTLKGMAIDTVKRRPLLGNITGGLSGPAIKPVAMHMVFQVAGAVNIPVVGCGGISTSQDAIEFIMAGASAVQVGTVTFNNPNALPDIIGGIERFMEKEGIKNLTEIIGAARK
jgi:dihydroorotate dehydrogenase (NAD+) catalytic subunit